ncbi:9657_t:CDS:2, partial [Gigaspora margarita]
EEFGRIGYSIDNSQEETRKPLLSTSQSFNISISSTEDLSTLFLASNIEQRIEQEAENEEVEHEAEEIDNEKIEQIKKFKIALNYSSSEENSETEQENDFEDSSSIRDTGLLDDIELEDSDIESETILSFKTFTLPYTAITALLIFIKALVFNDDSNFSETLYKAKDAISFKKTIIQFVVCEKYHFLTNLESISDNSQASCSECKTLLKKPIRTSKGKIIYKPIKVYPYQSTLSQLAALLQWSGFEELLESYQFIIDNYSLQNIEEHKIIAEKWKYSVSSEHKQLFDQYGIRWSSFLQLSYFDSIKFSVFDPMHNIFLGTACKMMKIWTIETDLISKNQLTNIQNIVNNSSPPASIGRIPYKIASFSGFISDHYWYYAYERLNGQIASFYTSRRTVELDMLNYINQQIEIYGLLDQIKPTLTSNAQTSLDYLQNKQLAKGTLAIYNYTMPKIIEFQYSITNINCFVTGSEDYPRRLIKPFSEAYLSNDNLKLLVDYYTEIYSNDNLKFYAEGQ